MNWAALYAILSKKIDDISALQMKKVTELPETGETNTLYLVPKTTAEEGNYSDEYIWDDDLQEFEKVGDTQITPESDVVFFNVTYSAGGYILPSGKTMNDVLYALTNGKIVILRTSTNIYYMPLSASSINNLIFYTITSSDFSSGKYKISVLYYGNNTKFYSKEINYDNVLNNSSTFAPQTKAVYNALALKANISDIPTVPTDYTKDTATAPLYDSTATYAVGDICMYQKGLYKANTDISVAEDWNSSKWDAVTVLDVIDSKISNAVTSVLNTSF